MNDYEKTLYEKAAHDIYAKIPECLSAKELELFLKGSLAGFEAAIKTFNRVNGDQKIKEMLEEKK